MKRFFKIGKKRVVFSKIVSVEERVESFGHEGLKESLEVKTDGGHFITIPCSESERFLEEYDLFLDSLKEYSI